MPKKKDGQKVLKRTAAGLLFKKSKIKTSEKVCNKKLKLSPEKLIKI